MRGLVVREKAKRADGALACQGQGAGVIGPKWRVVAKMGPSRDSPQTRGMAGRVQTVTHRASWHHSTGRAGSGEGASEWRWPKPGRATGWTPARPARTPCRHRTLFWVVWHTRPSCLQGSAGPSGYSSIVIDPSGLGRKAGSHLPSVFPLHFFFISLLCSPPTQSTTNLHWRRTWLLGSPQPTKRGRRGAWRECVASK